MARSDNHWHAIRLTVSPDAVEAAEFAFNSLDARGTKTELIRRNASEVHITGYFDHFPEEETFQDELQYALRSYGLDQDAILNIERNIVENSDWLAEWKKHWTPTTIGNFVIAAPWHEVDEPGKIIIRIEPNMAFGTGTHETTQLCLKAIDELFTPGDSFLDVGTGTGILAIAAALMTNLLTDTENGNRTGGNPSDSDGVNRQGYDTDPDAIEIAGKNAGLNHVGSEIELLIGTIDESIPAFDFVCANLTLDVILPILPLLLSKAEKFLVLSGILKTQEETIMNELRDLEARDFQIETAGAWIATIIQTTGKK